MELILEPSCRFGGRSICQGVRAADPLPGLPPSPRCAKESDGRPHGHHNGRRGAKQETATCVRASNDADPKRNRRGATAHNTVRSVANLYRSPTMNSYAARSVSLRKTRLRGMRMATKHPPTASDSRKSSAKLAARPTMHMETLHKSSLLRAGLHSPQTRPLCIFKGAPLAKAPPDKVSS